MRWAQVLPSAGLPVIDMPHYLSKPDLGITVIEAADTEQCHVRPCITRKIGYPRFTNQYKLGTKGRWKQQNAHRQIAATAESVDPSQVSSITGAPPASLHRHRPESAHPPPSIGRGSQVHLLMCRLPLRTWLSCCRRNKSPIART